MTFLKIISRKMKMKKQKKKNKDVFILEKKIKEVEQ
jgi:hypothetical protein